MDITLPHMVDEFKPTIGGLPNRPHRVDYQRMVTATDLPFAKIGARLAAVRTGFSDLSQKSWAEKQGFNVTQYNNWERGIRRIPVDEAEKLADAYGLTLDFIYRGRRDGLSDTARNVL